MHVCFYLEGRVLLLKGVAEVDAVLRDQLCVFIHNYTHMSIYTRQSVNSVTTQPTCATHFSRPTHTHPHLHTHQPQTSPAGKTPPRPPACSRICSGSALSAPRPPKRASGGRGTRARPPVCFGVVLVRRVVDELRHLRGAGRGSVCTQTRARHVIRPTLPSCPSSSNSPPAGTPRRGGRTTRARAASGGCGTQRRGVRAARRGRGASWTRRRKRSCCLVLVNVWVCFVFCLCVCVGGWGSEWVMVLFCGCGWVGGCGKYT